MATTTSPSTTGKASLTTLPPELYPPIALALSLLPSPSQEAQEARYRQRMGLVGGGGNDEKFVVGPPALLPLLLTCKKIYGALRMDDNPGFWAEVWEGRFDTSAIKRRWPGWWRSSSFYPSPPSSSTGQNPVPSKSPTSLSHPSSLLPPSSASSPSTTSSTTDKPAADGQGKSTLGKPVPELEAIKFEKGKGRLLARVGREKLWSAERIEELGMGEDDAEKEEILRESGKGKRKEREGEESVNNRIPLRGPNDQGAGVLRAKDIALELKARCEMLARVRQRVLEDRLLLVYDGFSGQPIDIKALQNAEEHEKLQMLESTPEMISARKELKSDLWRIFLMLLEHDRLNLRHLLKYSYLIQFLTIFYQQDILYDALRPGSGGYPDETTERCLMVWCEWLTGEGSRAMDRESSEEGEERFFVVKPYVFAAHIFDAFHAPWPVKILPTGGGRARDTYGRSNYIGLSSSSTQSPNNPLAAKMDLRSRQEYITYFNRRILITPPLIAHAACYSFFERIERDPNLIALTGADAFGPVARNPPAPGAPTTGTVVGLGAGAGQAGPGPQALGGGMMSSLGGGLGDHHGTGPRSAFLRPPKPPAVREDTSKNHDRDFARLITCLDPVTSPGLPDLFFRGSVEGTWEGKFSFFDFDSYREMLGGHVRSLYEGPFGCQPQVWKIEERVVMARVDEGETVGGKGPILNAGYEIGGSATFGGVRVATFHPRTSGSASNAAATAAASGERINQGVDRNSTSASEPNSGEGGGTTPGLDRTIGPDGMPTAKRMKSTPPEEGDTGRRREDDEDMDNEDPNVKYEILLSGTGHSAWGQFILRGRIRSWDGLVSLTKEYTPDGRGRWLYRGYLTGSDSIVGRWRDTFTPEDTYGYEGTFVMERRITV